MKKHLYLFGIFLLVLIVPCITSAADTTTSSSSTSSTDASSLVYVSNVTMDPEEFFPYETGTITVTLTNGGTSSVGLSGPSILSEKIHVVNKEIWNTMSYIGPGSTITYSFRIMADPPDGTYFPLFSVGTKDGGSVHYSLIVKVSSKEIKAVVAEQPEAFAQGASEPVNLSIVNPRGGAIRNIIITPTGAGITVSPAQKYISSLAGEGSTEIPFTVTTDKISTLNFHISYQNGDTDHEQDVTMPIEFGEDKTAAVPILNNVALSSKGSYYDITGDITNTGITDAKGLLVKVGSPATGTGTYPEYAIGSLASDDSGSFELTFACSDLSSVPLTISWKDSDGDDCVTTKTLDLRSLAVTGMAAAPGSGASFAGTGGSMGTRGSAGGMSGGPSSMGSGGPPGSSTNLFSARGGGISSFYPVIAAGILGIAGIVMYWKRKWVLAKLKRS